MPCGMMHNLHIRHHHIHSIHADLAATQRLSDALPTFSCRSTPFRVSRSSQQRIGSLQRHTPLARSDGTALRAVPSCNSRDALDAEKARRTAGDSVAHAADAGGQRRALAGDRSGGSAGTAKRVQNPSFARRISLSGVLGAAPRDRGGDGVRHWRASNRPRCAASRHCREERVHSQPRQRDRREWRDDPTRTNTSGRSHHVTVEGLGMRPTGFPSKDTDTHRPSGHAQAREARPAQALTHLAPAPVLTPLPELPPHAAPAPSPLSEVEKDSTTAARIVAGFRRNEPVRSRRRQRARRRLAAHHARVASSVRLSVSSLLTWMSLG